METAARRKAVLAGESDHKQLPASAEDIPAKDFGQVEVVRAVTVQVEQYHPVVTSVALRLPIDSGESPVDAINRVMQIVDDALNPAVEKVCAEGFKWRNPKR